ncbi:hypothetical protein G7Y89_g3208 [Cudoniella acicularis]|uniref:Uncharacterized protein n=1 Tax=Cudoniella acicularis TaxID=354080 RepID=A0A8H4RSP2_9HELO|nr:hypothetical protein G7Y89_g3208 [Cudoniella acicularis]
MHPLIVHLYNPVNGNSALSISSPRIANLSCLEAAAISPAQTRSSIAFLATSGARISFIHLTFRLPTIRMHRRNHRLPACELQRPSFNMYSLLPQKPPYDEVMVIQRKTKHEIQQHRHHHRHAIPPLLRAHTRHRQQLHHMHATKPPPICANRLSGVRPDEHGLVDDAVDDAAVAGVVPQQSDGPREGDEQREEVGDAAGEDGGGGAGEAGEGEDDSTAEEREETDDFCGGGGGRNAVPRVCVGGSTEFEEDIDSLVEVDFVSSFFSGTSKGRSSTTVRFGVSFLSTKELRIAAAAPFTDEKRLPQTSTPAPPLTEALSVKINSRSRS